MAPGRDVLLRGVGPVAALRITTGSAGVTTITTVGVAATRRRITTRRADSAVPETDRDAVAVQHLQVPGSGVAAVAAGGVGVTTGDVVVALIGARLVRLTNQRLGDATEHVIDRGQRRACRRRGERCDSTSRQQRAETSSHAFVPFVRLLDLRPGNTASRRGLEVL